MAPELRRGLLSLLPIAVAALIACAGDADKPDRHSGQSRPQQDDGDHRDDSTTPPDPPGPGAAMTPFQRARGHFARAVASTYGVEPASIDVRPSEPGDTEEYRSQDIGDLYAMAAVFGKRRITGFASARGDVVLARRPKQFGPLVAATDDPVALAQRVAWLMGGEVTIAASLADTDGESGPGWPAKPIWRDDDGKRALVFFTAEHDGSGSVEVQRYELRVTGEDAVLEKQ